MKRKQKGFTLAETMIVVAILLILAALVFVGVWQYLRSLTQLEYDNAAKEIFVVAQNHLTMAKSQGYLGKTDFGTQEGTNENVYYYIYGADGVNYGEKSLLDVMLPFGAVDETLRAGGSYIIRYDKNAGAVLDVFYSAKPGNGRFGHSYSTSEYSTLIKEEGEDYRSESYKQKRRYYGGDVLGYYGGVAASTLEHISLEPPSIQVINAEKLKVIVTNPNKVDDTKIRLQLKITGLTSKKEEIVNLTLSDSVGGSGSSFEVILDDVTTPGKHFSEQFANLFPGENITIQAVCYGVGVISNYAVSSTETTNSLFGYENGARTAVSGADGSNTATAEIYNIRHLENLDPQISGLSNITVTAANQENDLSWPEFKTAIGGSTVSIYEKKKADNTVTGTKANCFAPVTPQSGLAYNGKGHKISEVTVDTTGNGGLFGTLDGGSVANLELVDFQIKGSNAGALAGESNSAINKVLAYNTQEKDKLTGEQQLKINGTGDAGGLIGKMTGGSVTDSAAAVYVNAGGNGGGLIGTVSSGSVTESYSGGHTQNGEYERDQANVTAGASAGGLIGSFSGTKVENSYSTCSAKGSSTVGGLIGTSQGTVNINNCYATGLVVGTGTKGAFIGRSDGASGSGNSYFGIINETLGAVGSGTFTGVSAFDQNLSTYQAFLGTGYTNNPATAYDPLLTVTYQGKYALKTVSQITRSDTDLNNHIGDWPAPETLVENTR